MCINLESSGIDVCSICTQFKKDPLLKDIPIIVSTDLSSDINVHIKVLESGAQAFISKPINTIELNIQIRSMMGIRFSNKRARNEKEKLAIMVEQKVKELKDSHDKTLQLLDTVKKEQAFIEAIFESIPGYMYVYDDTGKLIRWNKKHEIMTGYSAQELSQMTIDKWYDDEEIIKVKEAINDVFEKGYGEVESKLTLKDGSKIYTRNSGAPLVWDGKNYFTGIGVDISEQKRMQEDLLESHAIMETAFKNSQAGIAIAEAPSGTLRYVNQAGLLIRNKSEEEIVKNIGIHDYVDRWNILHFDGTPYAEEEVPLTRAILFGEMSTEEFIIRRDNFEDRYVLANAAPIRDSQQTIKAGIMVFLDITDRKKLEMQLKRNMDDLLESQSVAHVGSWRLDLRTNTIGLSEELNKMYGFNPEEPPPPYLEHKKLYTEESWEKLSSCIEEIQKTGIPYEVELETAKHGWIWARGEAIRDSDGTIIGLWGVTHDITERKKTEQDLIYLSYHDHLTKLHNRRYFEEELIQLDCKENLPISIIMCDVNGLKLVNDSFGHESGDTLLKHAADTIKSACRKQDLIARIGGDEFVIVLPQTTAEESEHIANIMKKLALKKVVANIELSISYGFETKTLENESIMDVLARAENHMYKHKLYERASIRSKTIDLIMNSLFEKSGREALHAKRVSMLCQEISLKMNFSATSVNQMRIAGFIHDIGKIGIDEKILNKIGTLTNEEMLEIERHPEIGWKILNSASEFTELAEFVLAHHESWDGSGYPNGLAGEKIPIESRIITVANAYAAMTSSDSYKQNISKEDAIKELKRCSGTQFDPTIVNALVDIVLQEPSEQLREAIQASSQRLPLS